MSTDTLRTRRSHRSVSKDRGKGERRRDRGDPDEKRKRSRSRDRSERGYRDRSRDRHRERDRERDRDRGGRRERESERHRRHDGTDSRHGHRDRDRDRDRDDKDRDRRRKRDDFDGSERDHDDRVKRKRSEIIDDIPPPPPPPSSTLPPPPPPRDSPLSVRSTDRKKGDRHVSRDPFEDSRVPNRRSASRNLVDEEDLEPLLSRKSPPLPGVRYAYTVPYLSNKHLTKCRRNSPSYPSYDNPMDETYNPDEPKEDDSEARSVFVSQLAARLTARDLGYFFEDKLGEGTVMDSRIVTDRLSRRSKG